MSNYDPIVDYLPRGGLIDQFMRFTGETEICPRFKFFTLMGSIGAIVNRKVYLQRGSKETFPTLYPNPWILLIAPQGQGHKSTALSIGRKLMQALPVEKRPRIFSSKITPEALVKAMSSSLGAMKDITDEGILKVLKKKSIGCLFSSELGVLLGRERYLQGSVMLLTDLYDCPDEWKNETIMRSEECLYDVCLSALWASTPDWMQVLLPKDAFEIGFMSRLVLVPMPFNWHVRSIPRPRDKGEFDSIVGKLTHIASIEGEMKMTPACWDYYEEWYLSQPEQPPGPFKEYQTRLQDHILRLSMLIQISETGQLELDTPVFKQAAAIFRSISQEVNELIRYISMEPKMRIVQRILRIIEFKTEIKESELLSEVWPLLARPQEFDEVMMLLLKTKKIEIGQVQKEPLYRKRKGDKE